MNELTFIAVQFPASYLATGVWFRVVLPLMPSWVQSYRGYSVVRTVDYLTKDSCYYISTWIIYLLYIYAYTKATKDVWYVYFSFLSWLGAAGMEVALLISGKRTINLEKTAYWTSAGSFWVAFLLQSLREGPVFYGIPSLIVASSLVRQDYPNLFWLGVVSTVFDFVGILHLVFYEKERRPKSLGSTNVTGRRYILDTIFYRFVELAVIYYIYTLCPQDFYDRTPWIIGVSCYRIVQLVVFFGLGTYLGQTWIDAGPHQPINDTWFLNIAGVTFRVLETITCGFPKAIALTILFEKALNKL